MWAEETFLGSEIRPVPTLIYSEEADELIAERCMDLGYGEMWPIYWETPEPGRKWIDVVAGIKKFAMEYTGPNGKTNALIIIDTLSRHWNIEDENNNAMVEGVLNPLIAVVRKTGCAVVLIHHTRKSGGSGGVASRGGSALVGAVDVILEMARVGKDRTTKRRLEGYSRYKGTPDDIIIQLTDDGYIVAKDDFDMEADDPSAGLRGGSTESRVRQWLRMHDGWWQADAIAGAMGLGVRTVREACAFLTAREEIEAQGDGKKGHPYQYSGTLEEDVE